MHRWTDDTTQACTDGQMIQHTHVQTDRQYSIHTQTHTRTDGHTIQLPHNSQGSQIKGHLGPLLQLTMLYLFKAADHIAWTIAGLYNNCKMKHIRITTCTLQNFMMINILSLLLLNPYSHMKCVNQNSVIYCNTIKHNIQYSIAPCFSLLVHICDLLCQNPPLTHTMSKNTFHRQWIAPSIN